MFVHEAKKIFEKYKTESNPKNKSQCLLPINMIIFLRITIHMEDMNAEKKKNRQINVLLLIVTWDIYLIIKKENV